MRLRKTVLLICFLLVGCPGASGPPGQKAHHTSCVDREVVRGGRTVLFFFTEHGFEVLNYINIRHRHVGSDVAVGVLELTDRDLVLQPPVAEGFEFGGLDRVGKKVTLVINNATHSMEGDYYMETSHAQEEELWTKCKLKVTEPVACEQASPVILGMVVGMFFMLIFIIINQLGSPDCTLRQIITHMRKKQDRQRDQSPPTEIKVVGQSEDGGRKNDFTETNDQGIIDQVKWKNPMPATSSEHVSGQEEGDMLGDNPVDRVMEERQDLLSN